jgi:hypothetical protein
MHRGGVSLVGDEIPGPGGQSVDGEHTSKVPLPLYSLLLLLSSINHKPHTPHCLYALVRLDVRVCYKLVVFLCLDPPCSFL